MQVSGKDLVGKVVSVNKKDGNKQTIKGKVVGASGDAIYIKTGEEVTEIPVKDIQNIDDLFGSKNG